MQRENKWRDRFDKRFCSFNLSTHKICNKCDGKPFDGSSVADHCGSADEYIKSFIQSEIDRAVAEEREKLRVHIEREVIEPLLDHSKKFGVSEAIKALRNNL